MSQFHAGQLVRLKSGSPLMAAEGDDDYGRVICSWFDEKNKPQQRAFAAEALRSAEGEDNTTGIAEPI